MAASRVITVQGAGAVTAVPDCATLSLGVESRARTAGAALSQTGERATALVELLRAEGIGAADVQTSQVSLYPVYAEDRVGGYQASTILTVTVHEIADVGQLLDAAAATAGDALRVHGLSFTISEPAALLAEAREHAVRAAAAIARQLADAAGVELGAVLSIREGSASPPMRYARADAMAAKGGVPIEAGTQELTVTVEVGYEIVS